MNNTGSIQRRPGKGRNLRSGLKRQRRRGTAMQTYDALPRPLRQWLAQACLPWSPTSALKIWERAGGARNPSAAIGRLERIEKAMLRQDTQVWSLEA